MIFVLLVLALLYISEHLHDSCGGKSYTAALVCYMLSVLWDFDSSSSRDVNWKPEIQFSVLKLKSVSISLATGFWILLLLSFLLRKLHKSYQMSDKVNSHICLLLCVYKSFHQTVKYCSQRNQILQDLTGLETKISMKASKTRTGFKPLFNNQNRFAKNLLTSLISNKVCRGLVVMRKYVWSFIVSFWSSFKIQKVN